jgi:hypothetical protein
MATRSVFQFSPTSLLAWTAAYAIWEPISYFVIRALSSAKTVGEYYDPKRMPIPIVFFGDFIYSTFILLIAQQAIASWIAPQALVTPMGWIHALLLFLGVQWISDFSFYQLITRVPPVTRYIDFFQRYTKEVSFTAILGDSGYGVVWLSLAQALATYVPSWIQITLITLFLFSTLVVSY